MSLTFPLTADAGALLASRLEQRILPGLERMRMALDGLAHPERTFASLLVLGTNGKGSTAALLAAVLQAHGVRTGLYTSPHLVAVEERIRVDGATIPARRLAELVAQLNRFPQLSYFEALTCAAICEFAESHVEVAVLEAGLGGRWDAVNAVEPTVALLTNVGTDHQAWLGENRAAIAAEKAAALRGREAIVGAWDDEVEPVIRASADPATPISRASQWATVKGRDKGRGKRGEEDHDLGALPSALSPSPLVPPGENVVAFRVGTLRGEAALPLPGDHQRANFKLALAGASALAKHGVIPPLGAGAIKAGIEALRWPGRLQWIAWDRRHMLLDGAHNLEAMQALAGSLDRMRLASKPHLLFSCLADKPLAEMAALLRPRVASVTVAPIASPRATPVDALAACFPGCRAAASAGEALASLPRNIPTLVTGSLRFVGELLAMIEARNG